MTVRQVALVDARSLDPEPVLMRLFFDVERMRAELAGGRGVSAAATLHEPAAARRFRRRELRVVNVSERPGLLFSDDYPELFCCRPEVWQALLGHTGWRLVTR